MYSRFYKTDLKSNTSLIIKIGILIAVLWGGLLSSAKAQLTLSSSVNWGDDKYMENIFGISSIQATNSTPGYSAYSVASGFKDVGVNVSVRHFMTQNIGIMGQIG